MLSVTPWVTPKEVSEVSSEHVAMEQLVIQEIIYPMNQS